MILWSIQPLHILKLIQDTGTYICDPKQIPVPDFSEPYDWLAKKWPKGSALLHPGPASPSGHGICRTLKGKSPTYAENVEMICSLLRDSEK